MKRSVPLTRTPMKRRPKRANERLAQGRRSLTLGEYRKEKAKVRERSGGWCEVVLDLVESCNGEFGGRCPDRARDYHHVQPRSRGGTDDASNLLHVCAWHHRRVDFPYAKGKLVIRARPGEPASFDCALVYARDKFAAREAGAD